MDTSAKTIWREQLPLPELIALDESGETVAYVTIASVKQFYSEVTVELLGTIAVHGKSTGRRANLSIPVRSALAEPEPIPETLQPLIQRLLERADFE